jgi:hypothetical protein
VTILNTKFLSGRYCHIECKKGVILSYKLELLRIFTITGGTLGGRKGSLMCVGTILVCMCVCIIVCVPVPNICLTFLTKWHIPVPTVAVICLIKILVD